MNGPLMIMIMPTPLNNVLLPEKKKKLLGTFGLFNPINCPFFFSKQEKNIDLRLRGYCLVMQEARGHRGEEVIN